jgi:hypothetical protein
VLQKRRSSSSVAQAVAQRTPVVASRGFAEAAPRRAVGRSRRGGTRLPAGILDLATERGRGGGSRSLRRGRRARVGVLWEGRRSTAKKAGQPRRISLGRRGRRKEVAALPGSVGSGDRWPCLASLGRRRRRKEAAGEGPPSPPSSAQRAGAEARRAS